MNEPITTRQLVLVVLSLLSLGLLAAAVFPLDKETQQLLLWIDTAVCVVFLGDFSLRLRAGGWKYFRTWGWLDLLSSIPSIEALRVGRLARVFRLLRILRGVRAIRTIAEALMSRRRDNALAVVIMLALLCTTAASIAVLHFEPAAANGNIKTAEDALWWAVTTVTTVGYGDRFPVTPEGRLVGAALMCSGVGLFGTYCAIIASWFLQPSSDTAPNNSSL